MSNNKKIVKLINKDERLIERNSAPITFEQYDELWEAWQRKQSISYLEDVSGLSRDLIIQCIDKGWTVAGLMPLSDRLKSMREATVYLQDYSKAQAMKENASVNSMVLNRIYKTWGENLQNLSFDPKAFSNMDLREGLQLVKILTMIQDQQIKMLTDPDQKMEESIGVTGKHLEDFAKKASEMAKKHMKTALRENILDADEIIVDKVIVGDADGEC